VRIAAPGGSREADLEELFRAPGRLGLEAGELLAAILLPPPPPRSAAHYLRFTPRREMDIAVAGAGAWLHLDVGGAIAAARIVLAAVAPTPMRAGAAELRLIGERPTPTLFQEAARLAARDARPISDTRGSAGYRRELVAVLTARALAGCANRLAGAQCAFF
jgi:carbon-monoxide dehydrogenase medium subunit